VPTLVSSEELRGFASIGIMEGWSNGRMGLKDFLQFK
jgi:hypothetical protein